MTVCTQDSSNLFCESETHLYTHTHIIISSYCDSYRAAPEHTHVLVKMGSRPRRELLCRASYLHESFSFNSLDEKMVKCRRRASNAKPTASDENSLETMKIKIKTNVFNSSLQQQVYIIDALRQLFDMPASHPKREIRGQISRRAKTMARKFNDNCLKFHGGF